MVGIYQIKNMVNGKTYVGQSNDISRRWDQHLSASEWERYSEKPLYKAFLKYGIENFEFSILEECPLEQLNEKEIYWIKKLDSLCHHNGYNINSGGQSPAEENHPRHKLTKEDVIDIRTRYNNHERCKEVEKLYANKIGHSGFSKIWKGETWKSIMPEVYTIENKKFHRHNTGNVGSSNGRALLTEEDVYNIRIRKKDGETPKEVYKDYITTGIQYACFLQTWENRNWKHVVVE